MPKNLESAKLSHCTRNEEIYYLIKKWGTITRPNLVKHSNYKINEVCSAVGALMSDNLIGVVSKEINPDTGIEIEVLGLNYGQIVDMKSRRGELAKLRKENSELLEKLSQFKKNQDLLIKKLKEFMKEANL